MALKPVIAGFVAVPPPGTGTLPSQTGHAGQYLTTNGAVASWVAITTGGDVVASGTLTNDAIALGGGGSTVKTTATGTGIVTALGVNVGSAGAPVLLNGAGGTPSSIVLTNATGTAAGLTAGVASAVAVGGITGLGTGVATALAVNVGSAGAPVVLNGAGGTPSSLTGTNITGTAAGLTAGVASAVAASGITAGILGANITLGEETGQIVLDPALSANGKWSGIMEAGTAGAALAFGDLVYLAVADSRWELADASAASTSGLVKIGICVLAAAADGDPTNILLWGKVRAAVFPSMTVSAPQYISETAGDITGTQPTTTDAVIRTIGFANTSAELFFCPSSDYMTHV